MTGKNAAAKLVENGADEWASLDWAAVLVRQIMRAAGHEMPKAPLKEVKRRTTIKRRLAAVAAPHAEHSDEELEAECRMLGSMMLEPRLIAKPLPAIPLHAFCAPFHAAIYYATITLAVMGKNPDPLGVWWVVRDHPDSEAFGLPHLVDLASDAADPDRFVADHAMVLMRGFDVCAEMLDRQVLGLRP